MSSQPEEKISDSSREALVEEVMRENHGMSAWASLYRDEVAERLGLNSTDHKCLDLIKYGPMTPGDLARMTNLTTGAVTTVLDRLERSGFVRREHDSEDRRRIIVKADLEKLMAEVAPLFGCLRDGYAELTAGYSDAELQFLLDYFRKTQAMLHDAVQTLRERQAADAQPV